MWLVLMPLGACVSDGPAPAPAPVEAPRPAPTGELLGVRVGDPLPEDGYRCEAATCRRSASLAGVDGHLVVQLVDERVSRVSFAARGEGAYRTMGEWLYHEGWLPEGRHNREIARFLWFQRADGARVSLAWHPDSETAMMSVGGR